MNKIYRIAASALALLSLGACTDILDREPLDSFSDEQVWGDLSLSKAYLNNQYMYVEPENIKGTRFSNFTNEVFQKHVYSSDNVTSGLLSCDRYNLGYGGGNSTWDPWDFHYNAINEINIFLEHIDDVPGDEAERNAQKGQGLFLRAWHYHMLYSLYGRVPIVDHTYGLDDDYNLARSPLDDVADFIVKDLDEAAALLPLYYSAEDYGRATKGAALALKSRVLIYKASPLFGTPSQAKWQAASDAAKAVIDLGVYSLAPVNSSEEYSALFYNENNPEVIFLKLFDPKWGSGDNNSWLYQVPCGVGNGFQGWGNFNPTQNLVDKFQMADGTEPVINDYYVGQYVGDTPWQGREMRFYSAFLLDGDEWGFGSDRREVEVFWGNGEGIANGKDSFWGEYYWNASNTGYAMRKFLDPSYDPSGTTMHTTPWFFLRLSEIYLNYAECQMELGNNNVALEYINKVRTRVHLPEATGADLRKEYEYEREMELVFEGQRWFDLRRWKKMYEEYAEPIYGISIGKNADGTKFYIVDRENPIAVRSFTKDALYWMPVPRYELRKSDKLDGQPYE